jgi:hypothetical protein
MGRAAFLRTGAKKHREAVEQVMWHPRTRRQHCDPWQEALHPLGQQGGDFDHYGADP